MVAFIDGEYTLEQALEDQEAVAARKGRSLSEEAKESYKTLFMEVYKAIDSKQLKPLVRTQYMRTAFQVRKALRGGGGGGGGGKIGNT